MQRGWSMQTTRLRPPRRWSTSCLHILLLSALGGMLIRQWLHWLSRATGHEVDPTKLPCLTASCVTVDLKAAQHPMFMYGLFFEEINHGKIVDIILGGEGGLHVEILRDWSFEARAYLTEHPELAQASAWHMDPKPRKPGVPPAYKRKTALQWLSQDPATVASMALRDLEAWQITPHSMQVTILTLPTSATVSKAAGGAGPDAAAAAEALHAAFEDGFSRSATRPPTLHAICMEPKEGEFAQVVNAGHSLQGFTLRDQTNYRLRLRVKSTIEPITAAVTSPAGDRTFTSVTLTRRQNIQPSNSQGDWVTLQAVMANKDRGEGLRLAIRFTGPGQLCLDWVSLTLESAWSSDNHTLTQPFDAHMLDALKQLQPKFLRFPGGAYVEGTTLDTAYRWKAAVGPREVRQGHPNANWGYWSSDGLGLYEFMELAETLGAEPVWVLNVGISQSESVSPENLDPWLKDGMDSLEFILGSDTSRWGSVRAAMGRKAPWKLTYLTLGNEECLRPWYLQHYRVFASAVRDAYPRLKLIANCDLTGAPGLRPGVNMNDLDMWEFHSYKKPQDTFALHEAVDSYLGPPVAVTEFAAMADVESALAAIAEAGFMTALERNCHKFTMAAYAPLFGHDKMRSWRPDLVVFDDDKQWYGTPSFVMQRLFSQLAGKSCVHTALEGISSVQASTTCQDAHCNEATVKLVNFQATAQTVSLRVRHHHTHLSGWIGGGAHAATVEMRATQLFAENPNITHSFDQPATFAPKGITVQLALHGESHIQLPPYSLTVIHLQEAGWSKVITSGLPHRKG